MRGPGEVLVVSCYEVGRPPLAAATVVARLQRAGFRPVAIDLAVETLDPARCAGARLVAISVPMHTALRLGVRAARRLRERLPGAHVTFYGLYASLNERHLLDTLADSVIGGEPEEPLVELARALESGRPPHVDGVTTRDRSSPPRRQRPAADLPARAALPALERYARLERDGVQRLAGAVESTRGCLHLCRHCPIPPVYGGRFVALPREAVLADIRQLVEAGAEHITFADPDFLNGPTHARRIVRAMHARHPELTFDFTTKIEHLLRHRELVPEMAAAGCVFVVSAVESLSDSVLEQLDKGHTREDVFAALRILRDAGIVLRPSLLPFTPWSTIGDYEELLDWIENEALVGCIDPVQLSIRLLVPPGSLLAALPAMQPHLRGLVPEDFGHAWEHPDPEMDELHRTVSHIVGDAAGSGEPDERTFERIRRAAARHPRASRPQREITISPRRQHAPPRLTEPWFC